MILPDDLLNIVFDYKRQLEIITLNKEYKENVNYYYSSEHFSQLSFDNHVVSYYKGKKQLLCKIKNKKYKINGIYFDSIITIIK